MRIYSHRDDDHGLATGRVGQLDNHGERETLTDGYGPDGSLDGGEVREVDDTVPIHCACDEADVYAVQNPAYMRMRDRPAGR